MQFFRSDLIYALRKQMNMRSSYKISITYTKKAMLYE